MLQCSAACFSCNYCTSEPLAKPFAYLHNFNSKHERSATRTERPLRH